MCVCVRERTHMHVHLYMCIHVYRFQKRALESWNWSYRWLIVSCPVWVAGNQAQSSAIAVCALTHWVIHCSSPSVTYYTPHSATIRKDSRQEYLEPHNTRGVLPKPEFHTSLSADYQALNLPQPRNQES